MGLLLLLDLGCALLCAMEDPVHNPGVEQRIVGPRPRRLPRLEIGVVGCPIAQERENQYGMAPLEDVQSN